MNINLRQLRAFVSISHLGGFTKAAEALHATQPTLSAQINQLEESLGVRLFDRSTRSVTLTQVGRDLLPVVDKVLSDLAAVAVRARDVAQKNTGRVVVAALPSISSTLLPQAIAGFLKTYPGISISLKDALAERIVDMIRSDEVDFGISSSAMNDPQIEFTPLATDRMVLVLPRGHKLAKSAKISLEDLLDVPLIFMNRDSSVRRILDDAYASARQPATPSYEAAFMSTAIGMVRAGLGVTLLPSSALEVKTASDLVCRAINHPKLKRKIGILRKRRQSFSPAAASFAASLHALSRDWFRSEAELR
jgi:DNA-binding transcriptional LysR family regulator